MNKYNNIVDNDNNINFETFEFIYTHLRANDEQEKQDEFIDDDEEQEEEDDNDIIIKLSELDKDI